MSMTHNGEPQFIGEQATYLRGDYKDVFAKNEVIAQSSWNHAGSFAVDLTTADQPYYLLDMFPFPSGDGLHMGHVKGYTATDVVAHWKRRQGYDVIHPMGWDSFGLPAETAAIRTNSAPQDLIARNVANFKGQMKRLGLVYDEQRELSTSDPEYYRWTQDMFLEMYDEGLVRQEAAPVNWCEHCQTSLAHEDVEDNGTHDRCNQTISMKLIPQWSINMRSSAERLLSNMGQLGLWEEEIIDLQKNWIGKREGILTTATVGDDTALDVFIDASDLLKPMTNEHVVVISPETGKRLVEIGLQLPEDALAYIDANVYRPVQLRDAGNTPTNITATLGDIPLKIIISASAANTTFGAHISTTYKESSGIEDDTEAEVTYSELLSSGQAQHAVDYRLADWVFSRQRYWGEPIPIVYDEEGNHFPLSRNHLPLVLPTVSSVPEGIDGKSPLEQFRDWVEVRGSINAEGRFIEDPDSDTVYYRETDTMPNWAGSSWYFLRYLDPHNSEQALSREISEKVPQVDLYVGGMEHATRHLIYARFWNQFLYDCGIVAAEEPFKQVRHVGLVLGANGKKMSKSAGNGVNPNSMVDQYGGDATRLGMFEMGDFSERTVWRENVIATNVRYLEKIWRMAEKVEDVEPGSELVKASNNMLDTLNSALEEFRFGKALSAIKHYTNILSKQATIPAESYRFLIDTLQPFAPHIAEAIQSGAGGELAATRPWPVPFESTAETSQDAEDREAAILFGGKIIGRTALLGDGMPMTIPDGFTVQKVVPNSTKGPVIIVKKGTDN